MIGLFSWLALFRYKIYGIGDFIVIYVKLISSLGFIFFRFGGIVKWGGIFRIEREKWNKVIYFLYF